MAGPWVTEADVKQALADGLKKRVGELKDYWDRIVRRSVARAYTDLRNFLIGKSFTSGQLDAWDDARQYNLDQALFYCYVEGGGPEDESERDIRRLDRVTALMKQDDPLSLMIGGTLQAPGQTGDAGTIGGGCIRQTSDGIDYGTTFGLRTGRRDGRNSYGDEIGSNSGNEW